MKKRTAQIEGEKEIILPFKINGEQAWGKKKNIEQTGEDNEKLVDNLRDQKLRAANQKRAIAVLEAGFMFSEIIFRQVAPANVVDAFDKIQKGDDTDKQIFAMWVDSTGWSVIQDGLKTTVAMKSGVLASAEPPKKISGPRPDAVAKAVMEIVNE